MPAERNSGTNANDIFRLSPGAARDLIDIYEYIAQGGATPGKGHRREDLTGRPVLFWPVRSYQIIYRAQPETLEIIAVLHGKRNIKRLLKNR